MGKLRFLELKCKVMEDVRNHFGPQCGNKQLKFSHSSVNLSVPTHSLSLWSLGHLDRSLLLHSSKNVCLYPERILCRTILALIKELFWIGLTYLWTWMAGRCSMRRCPPRSLDFPPPPRVAIDDIYFSRPLTSHDRVICVRPDIAATFWCRAEV